MMTKDQLNALIAQGEGFHLEFKESVSKSIAKELVAFANAKGGKVLVGVDDDGNIKSKELDNSDRSKIQNMARDCDPSIDIGLESVDEEPSVFVVVVKEGVNKPYRCTDGFYMREGANSNKRTTHEIFEMFKDAGRFTFDDLICKKADVATYFDSKLLDRYFAESKQSRILSDGETLHNLDVVEEVEDTRVFNNTGVLFFTNEPVKFHSQVLIQCVKYEGIEKVNIEDHEDLGSDVITNLDRCFAFLKRWLKVGFKFESGNPTRIEVWEIPFQALKEAVVNAIAHRDYVAKGAHIQVEVFDDRVSITNHGGLAKGFSISDLGKRSFHRNPNIVNMLHRANFIEKLGTGIKRINTEIKNAGLEKAEFDVDDNWFTITFKRKVVETREGNNTKGESLSERDIKILNYCIEPRKRNQVLEHIGYSNDYRAFKSYVIPLMEKKYLSFTLPDSPRSSKQEYVTTDFGKTFL